MNSNLLTQRDIKTQMLETARKELQTQMAEYHNIKVQLAMTRQYINKLSIEQREITVKLNAERKKVRDDRCNRAKKYKQQNVSENNTTENPVQSEVRIKNAIKELRHNYILKNASNQDIIAELKKRSII